MAQVVDRASRPGHAPLDRCVRPDHDNRLGRAGQPPKHTIYLSDTYRTPAIRQLRWHRQPDSLLQARQVVGLSAGTCPGTCPDSTVNVWLSRALRRSCHGPSGPARNRPDGDGGDGSQDHLERRCRWARRPAAYARPPGCEGAPGDRIVDTGAHPSSLRIVIGCQDATPEAGS